MLLKGNPQATLSRVHKQVKTTKVQGKPQIIDVSQTSLTTDDLRQLRSFIESKSKSTKANRQPFVPFSPANQVQSLTHQESSPRDANFFQKRDESISPADMHLDG